MADDLIDVSMVEHCAEALRAARNTPGVGDPSRWDEASEYSRNCYRAEARAVLVAASTFRATQDTSHD